MEYFIITYNGSTPGESGESCRTEYLFENACEKCGTGAELKGPLRVKGISRTKRDFFETLDGDILITKTLYDKIRVKIPSLDLNRVVDTKNQLLDFYHLNTRGILPKLKDISSGYVREGQCLECNRNGYFNDVIIGAPTVVKPMDFRYQDSDFDNLSTEVILKTWECSGLSNKTAVGNKVVRFARPWIIIREDLKGIFEAEKIKNIQYEKIKIEGSVQQ